MALHSKKMLIVDILEILKKYTDDEHTLTQKDIKELLFKEYGTKVERKAIKRNLSDLIDSEDFEIRYDEIPRHSTGKCEMSEEDDSDEEDDMNVQLTNFSYVHEFTDAELKLLIDGLLFSRNIPVNQRTNLIEKLERLSSVHFKSEAKNILTVQSDTSKSKELFLNIEVINQAIKENRMIDFHYLAYQADKKLHKRITKSGKTQRFKVSPYNIVASNGRYYVICNNDFFERVFNDNKVTLTHFRIDRITDLKITDEKARPISDIIGHGSFSVSKHMAEHIYMYSDTPDRIIFRMKKGLLSELFDWFDADSVTFINENETEVTVSLLCSPSSMRIWAEQFARDVTILAPASLAELVKKDLKEAYERYENSEGL